MGASALLAVAGISFSLVPIDTGSAATPSEDAVNALVSDASEAATGYGPATTALQRDIDAALHSPAWPVLDPTLDSLLEGDQLISPEVAGCYPAAIADEAQCNYGSPTAPVKIVIVGDVVGAGYAEILRQMAESSNGQLLVLNQTMPSCVFTQDAIDREDVSPECPGRKDSAVDVINAVKPDAVLISNGYERDTVVGAHADVTSDQWVDSLNRIIARFSSSTTRIALLAPPPSNKSITECYGRRSSEPADCIGRIPAAWRARADAERGLAANVGGAWVDSRPWFCSAGQLCPAFVGTTPARVDQVHMAPPYASTVLPAFAESLRAAGVPVPG